MDETTITKRHYDTLDRLREECDYADHHNEGGPVFILRGQLGKFGGEKTLSDLERLHFLTTGINRFRKELGYRITDAGRDFENKPKPEKAKRRTALKTLPPRIAPLPPRL